MFSTKLCPPLVIIALLIRRCCLLSSRWTASCLFNMVAAPKYMAQSLQVRFSRASLLIDWQNSIWSSSFRKAARSCLHVVSDGRPEGIRSFLGSCSQLDIHRLLQTVFVIAPVLTLKLLRSDSIRKSDKLIAVAHMQHVFKDPIGDSQSRFLISSHGPLSVDADGKTATKETKTRILNRVAARLSKYLAPGFFSVLLFSAFRLSLVFLKICFFTPSVTSSGRYLPSSDWIEVKAERHRSSIAKSLKHCSSN